MLSDPDYLNIIYVTGPGHGAPGLIANTYLEGSYSELYPNITRDESGLHALFRQFSFPGGIPSHTAPETPGSIHEGGELGYSLSHAFGAAFDNPDLIVTCVVGDGEAETGPAATAWHSNKFLDPQRDGAVLPILHLNGYKIANPTVLARISGKELLDLFRGYGYTPYLIEGSDPQAVHQAMAATLDRVMDDNARIAQDLESIGKLSSQEQIRAARLAMEGGVSVWNMVAKLGLVSERELAQSFSRVLDLNLLQTGGQLLLVSQFTLAADTNSGNRPSFTPAAEPATGKRLFDYLLESARRELGEVPSGRFGAYMEVRLINDGPVTFSLRVPPNPQVP